MRDLAALAAFGDYTPADFGWAARDPEQDSALLAPFEYNGVSFGSMHVDVHGLFTALLDQLVPLIPGGLVAGTCGCYNPASVEQDGDRSFHTYGIAIDVNWAANPMGAPRRPTGPHTLPAATSSIARSFGCEWGGDWASPKDWMHIECHLHPDVASTVEPEDQMNLDADTRQWFKTLAQNNSKAVIKQITALSKRVAAIEATLQKGKS